MKTPALFLLIALVTQAGCAHKAPAAESTEASAPASADEDEEQGGGERVKP